MGGSHYRAEAEEMKERGERRERKPRRAEGHRPLERRGGGRPGMLFYFFRKLIEIARDHLPVDLCLWPGLIRSIRENREMSSASLSARDRGGSPRPQIESRNRFYTRYNSLRCRRWSDDTLLPRIFCPYIYMCACICVCVCVRVATHLARLTKLQRKLLRRADKVLADPFNAHSE